MKKILSLAFFCVLALTANAQKYLQYIESTGAVRENAFTTDYNPVTASQISISFRAYESNGWQAIFCARNKYAGTGISLYKNGDNQHFGYFTGGTTGAGDNFAPFSFNTDYEVVADVTNLQITANGETTDYPTGNTETNPTTRNLSFFANPEWDEPFRGRIYSASVKEDGNVVRDYVPAVTNKGELGLYDKKTKKMVFPAKGNYDGYNFPFEEGVTYILAHQQHSYTVKVGQTVTVEPVIVGPVPEGIILRGASGVTVDGMNVTGVTAGVWEVNIRVKDADNVTWLVPVTVEVVDESKSTFTPVEYIENFGGRKENAIITDYVPSTPTTVKLGFQQTGNNGWAAIFCARNTHAGTGISLYANGDNTHLGYFTGGSRGEADGFLDYENGKRYDIEANTKYLKWSVDGGEWNEKSTGNETMNATSSKVAFFANPLLDNTFKGKIYYAKIEEDGNVVYDLKPVLRHDGVFGFRDEATGKFFGPAEGNYADYTYGKLEGQEYVQLSTTALTMKNGDEETITVSGAEGGTWASSNEAVAVVENGVVTAVGVGKCTITYAVDTWKLAANVEVIPNTLDVDPENVTTWDGEAEAILPSIRYTAEHLRGAVQWAYTIDYNSGHGMGWTTSDPNFNFVVDAPAADENGKAWYEADYTMTNGRIASWTYNNTTLPNGWSDNTGDVYVRRYFKTVAGAELPETVYMPAPHDDAPCEYYINGTLVWSRTGFEPCNGWYEAEVVRLTDEQKALIKTDGSVNVFAYHVHQNWGGKYADGGLYIGGEPKNLYDGDAATRAYFEALLAKAEAVEGIDMEALAEARKHLNWRQDANDTWIIEDMICMEMRKVLSPRYEYAAASAEPADGLECWIYNVGTGQFLGGGNDRGTHTSVKAVPSSWPMVLHANTSGKNRYSIQTNLPNGVRGANDWLGHNGYVDCGGGNLTAEDWAWEFEPVGDGSYRIINSQNRGENIYLGLTEGRLYQVDTNKAGADNPYNHWKLITKAQFEALYEAATETAPANISYRIQQNTFSQNDFAGNDKGAANADMNDSKWERNAGSVWNWKGNDADGDYVYEIWNARNEADGKVYLKQTVEGLLPGKYVVSCNGFYRDGNWESAVAGNARQLAYLYAGTEENKVALKSILEDAGKAPLAGRDHDTYVIPNDCKDAAKYFQYGLYTNEIEVTVGADGKLELGVYREDADALEGDWIVVDNFQLTCVEAEPITTALNIRYNGNWDGVAMEKIETGDAAVKHFRYEGWISTNRDEGIFINFKDNEGNYWCPQNIDFVDEWVKLHTVGTGEKATDLVNTGDTEAAGYAVVAPTNMIAVDVYITADEGKVVFTNSAPQHAGDAIYITAEKYGWSREPDEAHTIAKIADGVYEGVVTITREDAYFDMVRLYTKPNNGDYDDFIGFNNNGRHTTYAANGVTYNLSYRPAGDFRMRKGDTEVYVDLNSGEVTFNYLGEKSYVYAVGNVKGQTWQNNNKDVKLWETKAGSLIYQGVVEIADEDGHEVTFFEERTADDWNAGRWGPKEGGKQPAAGQGEWYDGLNRWGDYAWKDIPAGKWLMTLDVQNDRFMYEPVEGELGNKTETVNGVVNHTDADEYDVKVDLYDNNTIVIRSWANAEDTDLYVAYNDEGQITYVTTVVDNELQERNITEDRFGLVWQIVETGNWDATVNLFFDGKVYLDSSAEVSVAEGKVVIFMQDPDDEELKYELTWGEGIVTGIDNINTDNAANRYNVAGQKVDKAFKGIVIEKGKKMLKKLVG